MVQYGSNCVLSSVIDTVVENQSNKSVFERDTMKIEKLTIQDLHILTELFDYSNVEQMMCNCAHDIQNRIIDVFVLYDQGILIGELRVRYESNDENYAIRDRRAYMYAFRVREDFRNKGYGTSLLKTVLSILKENGYYEFTVGVEDDNYNAIHMYQALGFNKFLCRKQEEYQGNVYEYNLYLKS